MYKYKTIHEVDLCVDGKMNMEPHFETFQKKEEIGIEFLSL